MDREATLPKILRPFIMASRMTTLRLPNHPDENRDPENRAGVLEAPYAVCAGYRLSPIWREWYFSPFEKGVGERSNAAIPFSSTLAKRYEIATAVSRLRNDHEGVSMLEATKGG